MRTTIEISMNQKSVDEVIQIVDTVMKVNNFQKKLLEGEEVWLKGDGVITFMQCLGICFKENSVLLQGWVKDAFMGESELKGFAGAVPKKKLRKIMHEIVSKVDK